MISPMNTHARILLAATLLAAFTCTAHAQEKTKTRSLRFESAYTPRTFKGTGDAELLYGWLAPLAPKPGEKYPLVICLHGSGGNCVGSGVLVRQAMREKYPTFVMVPKAESPFVWARTDLLNRRKSNTESPEKLPILIEALQSLLKTEAIDPARVYVTGQSLGGIGSWAAIARHPEIFAAAVPICGAWKVEDVPKMKPVPVWAFHGAEDNTVPTHFSQELTAALTKAGGTVKYTEYPGVGHGSWTQAYDDTEMWAWLFAQKKGSPAKQDK
jgi:predicted peptidase